MSVGLVCPRCDTLTSLAATRCPVCQAALGVEAAVPAGAAARSNGAPRALEDRMLTKPCPTCGNPVPLDDRSVNGVFLRIRSPARIESGSVFLIGEQLLQIEASAPDFGPQPDAEGTYFYASPKRASKMRLIQRLRGGDVGIIFRARGDT